MAAGACADCWGRAQRERITSQVAHRKNDFIMLSLELLFGTGAPARHLETLNHGSCASAVSIARSARGAMILYPDASGCNLRSDGSRLSMPRRVTVEKDESILVAMGLSASGSRRGFPGPAAAHWDG